MTRQPYSTANLFMLFLLSYNVLLAVTISYLYWGMWHGTSMGELIGSPWFLMVNQGIGLLLPLFIFRALCGEYRQMLLRFGSGISCVQQANTMRPLFIFRFAYSLKSFGLTNILLVIVLSLLLQPLMMLFSAVASLFLPNPVTGLISELAALPLPVALMIVALTPAICEELVFRGFIQSKYESQPIIIAAVVNGLFFGMIHMNLHQFAYAFAMGIVFAYMVYYTRSVFAGILAHFVVNATQYTLGYWTAAQISQPGSEDMALYAADVWQAIGGLGLISLFTLPATAGLFYIFVKHNRQRNPIGIVPINVTVTPADITDVDIPYIEAPVEAKSRHPFDMAFWAVVIIFGMLMVVLM